MTISRPSPDGGRFKYTAHHLNFTVSSSSPPNIKTGMEVGKKLRIAVVGGGVCGLTCALALAKEGIQVEVFEAAASFAEIGAGVGFGPNAVRILQDIGILDNVLSECGEPEASLRSFIFYSGMEGHEMVIDYPTNTRDLGLGLHRASFLNALVKNIDQKHTHNRKRCTRVSQGESRRGPVIHFEDGTAYEADVVLGADGIKSVVRNALIREGLEPPIGYSNTCCFRGLVPIEDVISAGVVTDLTRRPVCFIGFDKHIIIFPIKGSTVINVVAFATDRTLNIGEAPRPEGEPWVLPLSTNELLAEYKGWGSDVLKILGCIQAPSKWLIHVVYPPLSSYVKGRIALLGDSAHAMLPHLGAGAGQALEDAYLLAKLLSHPLTNDENVELVLQAYDHTRRKRAQMIWECSRAAGEKYEGRGEHGYTLQGLREDLRDLWEPVWRHELSTDVQEALSYLRTRGVF
ncbi:hypothetical protein BXZ70DRAFT_943202 [Cristinia sonorae]|uniref:FAD-binding domain-containing protein n=1 Tax=Cristinia sonorae TaxID=1940300 RepID=A0A8K0ULW4_9AGAR|nr:hypothetical protein BXZ70DRAFT_943202 [Cristinia sonorae]